MNSLPPSTPSLGQYYLLEKIAQGGMAEIFKGLAYDLHGIQRTVVIKKILPHAAANPEFIEMLVAEAKIAVMLSHGNIAQIFDLGIAGEDYFIVMEYVDGRTVSQVQRESLAQGRYMPIPIACHIAADAAAGLGYMHQRCDEQGQPLRIVHRDVSPQNIMLNSSGTVKIIDFGIAKARTKLETTEVGILKGKFAYMSPEHARGQIIDHRSDVFSLGVMLHELLTGRRLFKAKDHRDTLKNVRRADVPRPSTMREGIPEALDLVVLRALHRDVDERYQSADAMRRDLLKVLHHEFPDFRVAHVADYVSELFLQPDGEVTEEGDARTPFLIIDHTQSAIDAKAIDEGTVVHIGENDDSYAVPFLGDDASETATENTNTSRGEEVSLTMQRSSWRVRIELWWEAVLERLRTPAPRWMLAVALVCALSLLGWLSAPYVQEYFSKPAAPEMVMPEPPVQRVEAVSEIRVTSQPPGAQVFVDDVETTCITPCTLPDLVNGREYRLGWHLVGYRFAESAVVVQGLQEQKIDMVLVIDYATLSVGSTPAGARVTLGGREVGVTPWSAEKIDPGQAVQLRLDLPGYEPLVEDVPMPPGRDVKIHRSLRRQGKR